MSVHAFAAPSAPPLPPQAPVPPDVVRPRVLSPASPAAIELAAAIVPAGDPAATPGKGVLTADDEAFLDDLERRGIQFFLDEQHPETGLMPDRARAAGGASNDVASTASVGFGLTAYCIGVERGWVARDDAYARSLKVLKFLRDRMPHERGHFFHFIDMRTGARVWDCEVSNVDTALLMYGVLTVRQYFPGTELATIAGDLFDRVDWAWMLADDGVLHHGWKPETGTLKAKWGAFSEGPPLIVLLGLGSKSHPLPARAWEAWTRGPVVSYGGLTYMQCAPLFTHQYPQCWFDLRGQRDARTDYFRNSQLATVAHRHWTIDELAKQFPTYGPNVWGLSASDFKGGYTAWGGPPRQGEIDGTVVPCAAGGSLAFAPRACLDVLRELKAKYGAKGYVKYGFVDAMNPAADWYNRDVIGIDVGPTVLMAENCRTGFVWKTFMSAPEAQAAVKAAGFRPHAPGEMAAFATTSMVGAGGRPTEMKEVPEGR